MIKINDKDFDLDKLRSLAFNKWVKSGQIFYSDSEDFIQDCIVFSYKYKEKEGIKHLTYLINIVNWTLNNKIKSENTLKRKHSKIELWETDKDGSNESSIISYDFNHYKKVLLDEVKDIMGHYQDGDLSSITKQDMNRLKKIKETLDSNE